MVLSCFALVLSLIYSLFLYNRLIFGPINNVFIKFYSDVIRLEFMYLFPLVLIIIVVGVYPNIFSYFFLRYDCIV
jgi:NADH-quinone oxidoreductase subunit M